MKQNKKSKGKEMLTALPLQGFRMLIGNPAASTKEEADRYPQLTYTCLQDMNTRFPETKDFPKKPCPAGIMVNLRFPTYVPNLSFLFHSYNPTPLPVLSL